MNLFRSSYIRDGKLRAITFSAADEADARNFIGLWLTTWSAYYRDCKLIAIDKAPKIHSGQKPEDVGRQQLLC